MTHLLLSLTEKLRGTSSVVMLYLRKDMNTDEFQTRRQIQEALLS